MAQHQLQGAFIQASQSKDLAMLDVQYWKFHYTAILEEFHVHKRGRKRRHDHQLEPGREYFTHADGCAAIIYRARGSIIIKDMHIIATRKVYAITSFIRDVIHIPLKVTPFTRPCLACCVRGLALRDYTIDYRHKKVLKRQAV